MTEFCAAFPNGHQVPETKTLVSMKIMGKLKLTCEYEEEAGSFEQSFTDCCLNPSFMLDRLWSMPELLRAELV